jgi:hypothetical protein
MLVFIRAANCSCGDCACQKVGCENEDPSKTVESKDGSSSKRWRRRVVLWDESLEDDVQEDEENDKITRESHNMTVEHERFECSETGGEKR